MLPRVSVVLLVALCASLALSHAAEVDESETTMDYHAPRVPTRQEDPLEHDLADRASLLFRSMDHDRDRRIGEEDVRQSASQLAMHMPGVSQDEFLSFIESADKNGDRRLDRTELLQGIADGLAEARLAGEEQPADAGLVETEAETHRTGRRGIFGAIKRGVGNLKNKLLGAGRKLVGAVDVTQDGCVMCQYIVERCEGNVKQSGVIPSMSQVSAFGSFLEVESKEDDDSTNLPNEIPATRLDDDVSLLEVEQKEKQLFFDQTAAGIIGATRQSTRVQRQLERQKYNEIYRVVDITLDDVCEQGMPNSFYGYCKQIYKVQSDVVDGLRYQYRPSDICFRVGMCGKNSYITKGIHSRYK